MIRLEEKLERMAEQKGRAEKKIVGGRGKSTNRWEIAGEGVMG